LGFSFFPVIKGYLNRFEHLSGVGHSDFTTTCCGIVEIHLALPSLYFLLLKPTDFEPNIAVSALLEEHNTI